MAVSQSQRGCSTYCTHTHKFNLERKNLAGVHHQQSTTLTRLLNYLHLHVYFRRYPGTTDEL